MSIQWTMLYATSMIQSSLWASKAPRGPVVWSQAGTISSCNQQKQEKRALSSNTKTFQLKLSTSSCTLNDHYRSKGPGYHGLCFAFTASCLDYLSWCFFRYCSVLRNPEICSFLWAGFLPLRRILVTLSFFPSFKILSLYFINVSFHLFKGQFYLRSACH